MAIIFEHETMQCMGDKDALMNNISAEGYITELLDVTRSNERMSPLVVEVTNLGIRSMGASLNIPESDTGEYRELVDDVAESVNETASVKSVESRRKKLVKLIGENFSDAGIELSEDEKSIIAYHLIDVFGKKKDVSSTDIEDFFKDVSDGVVK